MEKDKFVVKNSVVMWVLINEGMASLISHLLCAYKYMDFEMNHPALGK
jgi:hypothetical protein